MTRNGDTPEARPISVPVAARELIRQIASERADGRPHAPQRMFAHEGVEWLARVVGEAAVGTGGLAPATMEAIGFCRAAAPDVPVREALLPCGRFAALFDEELCELLRTAPPVAPPPPPRS